MKDRHPPRQLPTWTLRGVMIGLALLLIVVMIMQYRWIGEISDAEDARLRGQRTAALSALATSLDEEVTRVCAGLMIDLNTVINRRWDDYAQRLAVWKSRVSSSRMIGRIWIVTAEREAQERILEWNDEDPSFREVAWPATLVNSRAILQRAIHPGEGALAGYTEETGGLTLPIVTMDQVTRGPRLLGYIVAEIRLDPIRTDILPPLIRRAFACEIAKCGYHFEIVSRRQPELTLIRLPDDRVPLRRSAEAEVAVFRVRPERLRQYAAENAAGPGAIFGLYRTPPAIRSEERGAWLIRLTPNTSGPDAAVAGLRIRNLSIGFIVLSLLGVNGYLLFLLAYRSRELAAMQTSFIAGISHDLRTPLTVLRSVGENLIDGCASGQAKTREYGRIVRAESERLYAMVDEVLEFARREGGRPPRMYRYASPRDLVCNALTDCQSEIERAGARVQVFMPESPTEILCDAASMRQLLRNLVINALKYNRPKGAIDISVLETLSGRRPFVELRVRDQGNGIPLADQRRIFEPFFRLSSARQSDIPGTGLGLYVVKRVVEEHHGTVAVESSSGHGCCFVVRLPLRSLNLAGNSCITSAPPAPLE